MRVVETQKDSQVSAPGLDIPNLILRAKKGEQDAFGELVENCYPRIFRQAVQLCQSESVADELVEETFVQAWRSLKSFDETCQFTTWLAAILFNQFRGWRRKQFRLSLFEEWFGAHQTAVDSKSPVVELGQEERKKILWGCVNRLPKRQAQVLHLRFLEGSSIASIAQVTKTSEGTIKSRLFTALKNLRRMPEMKYLEEL